MTDYEVRKLANAICEILVTNDKFMANVAKMVQRDKLLTTREAAAVLGVPQFTVRRKAAELGGILMANGRWMFREAGLVDRYIGKT